MNRISGIAVGLGLALCGIVAGAGGGALYLAPPPAIPPVPSVRASTAAEAEACVASARSSVPGVAAAPIDGKVEVLNPTPSSPGEGWLAEAQSAILACPGWTMAEFCAGPACTRRDQAGGWWIVMAPPTR